MRVVILANFAGDFSPSDNSRFIYLAKELNKKGHEVEFITSSFNHRNKQFRSQPHCKGVKITLVDEIGYKRNISIKRFISHFIWGQNIKKYFSKMQKPDVVFAAVPSLTGPLNVARYCKKNGIKFIVDVNDIWPEAFKMFFNIPIVSDILFAPLTCYANAIYRKADVIFGVSNTYVERALAVNHKAKGYAVYIGTDLDAFDKNAKKYPVVKDSNELWLGYCGSLSASYDLITVIDALSILKTQNCVVPKFIVMGDGARRQEFEEYAKKKNVDAKFTGFLPYDQMCGMLCACDMVVNPITGKSAASIINKHADYAACGKPVINTQDSYEYRRLVEDYQMGFNVENGSPDDMSKRIQVMLSDEEMRKKMGRNGRFVAGLFFDRKRIYIKVCDLILNENEKTN